MSAVRKIMPISQVYLMSLNLHIPMTAIYAGVTPESSSAAGV